MKCDPLELIMSSEDMEPHHKSWAWEMPAHYLNEARGLVDKLLKAGIITQVKHPVQWCTQGFFVEKPGAPGAPLRLRLVTDYREFNKVLKRRELPFCYQRMQSEGKLTATPRSSVLWIFVKAVSKCQ